MNSMLEIKKILTSDSEYNEIVKNHFFRNPVYSEALKNICISPGVSLYAAINNGKVCGFAAADDATADVCSLMSLSVAPEYRKRGFAKAILNYILKDRMPKALVAECLEDSLGFFENYGFYAIPLGEKQPGKNVYYATYRNI